MTKVSLNKLNKVYTGNVSAVRDLDLAIADGKITALLGPSGCGKTTTLKMIAGLLQPTGGDILFDGETVLSVSAENRHAVMVFQNHLLFPHMNVGENVGFGLRMAGMPKVKRREKIARILELVQLAGFENRRPNQLSGGQRQRVALARALVVDPRVLLLDEPLSNLDAHLRDEMRALILRVQARTNVTTIVVTHDQEEAVILAHEIALMFAGELAQVGEPKVFYDRPKTAQVARFFGGTNFIAGKVNKDGFDTEIGRFHLDNIRTDITPTSLTVRPENLSFATDQSCNIIPVTVTDKLFAGTFTRYQFAAQDGTPLQMTTAASDADRFDIGDSTALYLAPSKSWLL